METIPTSSNSSFLLIAGVGRTTVIHILHIHVLLMVVIVVVVTPIIREWAGTLTAGRRR